jgi:anti-sigma factor RsiW
MIVTTIFPPVGDEDLVHYVDNDLTPERRRVVEGHLRDNPEVACRVAADMRTVADLRRAFSGLRGEHASAAFPMRRRSAVPPTLVAAIAFGAVLGGVVGWTFKSGIPLLPPGSFLADAMAAHRTYAVEVAHPVEVAAAKADHLATWLSKRLQRQVILPDLRVTGLSLIGGRLLPGPDTPAAQLMYEMQDATRITIYMRGGDVGDPMFRFVKVDNEQAFYWADATFRYALTGAVAQNRLLEIAHLIQGQIVPPVATTHSRDTL